LVPQANNNCTPAAEVRNTLSPESAKINKRVSFKDVEQTGSTTVEIHEDSKSEEVIAADPPKNVEVVIDVEGKTQEASPDSSVTKEPEVVEQKPESSDDKDKEIETMEDPQDTLKEPFGSGIIRTESDTEKSADLIQAESELSLSP
jgi:hypothetical protein